MIARITEQSSVAEVAAIVSDALEGAGIELPVGKLRIITPTQSVMDRLAAAYAWKDAQSRDQAIMVAVNQDIDWESLRTWFANEGETDEEFRRFRDAVRAAKSRRANT